MFESEAAPLFKTVYGLLRAGERTFFKKEDLLNQCGEALDPAGLGSLIEGFVSEDALYFSYKESLDGKRTARFLLDSGHLETISAASYLAAAETALGITIDDGPVMVIDYRDCSRHELAVDDPGSIGRGMDAVASYLERSGNDPAARPAPVRRVLLLSPHGWFAQKDVLGRPDTGGQVVYILDEVRALEREITAALKRSGQEGTPEICILTRLIPEADGTSCDQPLENVEGTDFAYILRVPFRNGQGEVLREWIPRFQVWPHMERFAREAAGTVENVMGGAPDLIIGNYSDGNLAAVVLADIFSAPLAIVAHALEKSKYAHSDVFWQRYQEEYHFAEQFAADLLAMNSADFIITSTLQEITGTADTEGQYQGHEFFTLPGLFRVQNGIDVRSARFNIISPGVDLQVYFPYSRHDERDRARTERVGKLLFSDQRPDIVGRLEDPGKRPLFTMARLDSIKNITGLVEAFGASPNLRKRANLILVAGKVSEDEADSEEEKEQVRRMYELIDRHDLHGCVRWLGIGLPKPDAAEVYRVIADNGGIFVQPALYEAFGLTVLEAMHSGVPTAATRYGGPLEIIRHETDGFLLDVKDQAAFTVALAGILDEMDRDGACWERISKAGIRRVEEQYNWSVYCRRLLRAAGLYRQLREYEDEGRAQGRRSCNRHLFETLYRLLVERFNPERQALDE